MAWKGIDEKYSGMNTLMDVIPSYLFSVTLFSHMNTFTHIPYTHQGHLPIDQQSHLLPKGTPGIAPRVKSSNAPKGRIQWIKKECQSLEDLVGNAELIRNTRISLRIQETLISSSGDREWRA